MINQRTIFLILLVLSLWSGRSYGQLYVSHEVGAITGPAGFFTDYGERWNVRNNLENEGFGVGLVYYANIAYKPYCNCKPTSLFFQKHFRLRAEIDYLRSKLEHYGPVASKNTDSGRQLRAMHGNTELYQGGLTLEYHFFGIKEARDFAVRFAPFIGMGVNYVHFRPDAYSDLGPLDSPKVLFNTFEDGLFLEPDDTFSVQGVAGLRYRLGRRNDLQLEARAIYYDSDSIEGLDVQGPQNKFNDFVLWFNLGYIVYLN